MRKQRSDSVDASVSPTPRDLEWAAGFLDGEGFFGRQSRGSGQRIIARQRYPWPVMRLRRLFGGHLSVFNHASTAFTGTKYEQPRKPLWTWETQGPRARGIMFTLYGLLSPYRKSQILRAFGHEDFAANLMQRELNTRKD